MSDLVRNNHIKKPTLLKSVPFHSPRGRLTLTRPRVWVFLILLMFTCAAADSKTMPRDASAESGIAISGVCERPAQPQDRSAQVRYPSNLWKGILGEAANQGEKGLYAVACVYRNRLEKGMPLGCVALKRKDLDAFVKKQGVAYELIAKRIIHEVFINQSLDVTNATTHYENVKAFGWPRWAKDMIITCKIGDHVFFRERR